MNQTEKEELIQLVMLSFFNTSKTFHYDESKGRFRDYLKRIIQNKAFDLMRKRQDNVEPLDDDFINQLPAEVEDRWEREWQELTLKQAFEELKLRCDPTTLQSYDLFVFQKQHKNT